MDVVYAHPKIVKFFNSFGPSVRAEIDRTLELLGEKGYTLRAPDSKSLGKGLFELRIIDQVHIRIIYIFSGRRAVLLHAFVKKTGSISKRDMAYARHMQALCRVLA